MKLALSEGQQDEMCYAYNDGAPGILTSGIVWLIAALVCHLFGMQQAIWTLLIGGSLIHPISILLTKAIGRPAKLSTFNALNQLGMASTIWLILCCAMAYGLSLFMPALFFPAMMATIGCRYLVFATLFGKNVFWVMGSILIIAGCFAYFAAIPYTFAAALGGLIEVLFALLVFSKASKPALQL